MVSRLSERSVAHGRALAKSQASTSGNCCASLARSAVAVPFSAKPSSFPDASTNNDFTLSAVCSVCHCPAAPFAGGASSTWISPQARIEEGVTIEGPCFIDAGAVVKTGARVGPYTVIGRQCWIEEHATLARAIVWPNSRISQEAVVRGSILGRHCHVGRSALIENGVVLGDKSVITDYSRL